MEYGYIRVSTKHQEKGNSLEDQKNKILEKYPHAIIIEEAYSGIKKRPKFESLVNSLVAGDVLAVTKLDRFCRSAMDGMSFIKQLSEKKVAVDVLNMGRIEDTPVGKMVYTILLAVAEFERELIIERTQSGKDIAKKSPDFKEGRPLKYSRKRLDHSLELLETKTYKEVELITGISKSTIRRYALRLEREKLEKEEKNFDKKI